MLRFLAGCVQNGSDLARAMRGCLQQERGLSDTGLSAQQHERARDHTAAEHAIEFSDACGDPHGVSGLHLGVELGGSTRTQLRVAMIGRAGRHV